MLNRRKRMNSRPEYLWYFNCSCDVLRFSATFIFVLIRIGRIILLQYDCKNRLFMIILYYPNVPTVNIVILAVKRKTIPNICNKNL